MDSGENDRASADDGSQDGPTDTMSSFDAQPFKPILCNNKACACNNEIDDDADGVIDGFDPECTGPFDDDESSFATGKLIENNSPCQDCFFDANSGHGDDGCQYHSECLQGGIPSETTSSDCPLDCAVSDRCIDSCLPRTPNGCDCFGCCEVTKKDKSRINVRIVGTCSLAKIDDPTACPRCVRNEACQNACGLCELCIGKVNDDLPERCKANSNESGFDYSCDGDEQVCSATVLCKDYEYCYQGCCLPVLI